jgi:hypothetical protein
VVAAQASGLAQKAKSAVAAKTTDDDALYPTTPLNTSPNGLGGN